MDSNKRHETILKLIEEQGSVQVSDLCTRFGVSEMTIRRDLAHLERTGLVRRVYGGAVSARGRSYEPPFLARASEHREEKERIGRVAASLVNDGDSIALDVGTTTLEVARHLVDKHNLSVITNSLQIANVLANRPGIRLIIAGGILRSGELSMIGHLAERAFREFYVDKLFLGVGGISLEAGLTEFNLEDALIKQAMLSTAKECIVVADASKLNRIAFAKIAPLSVAHQLVTDSSADAETVKRLEEAGVRIVLT